MPKNLLCRSSFTILCILRKKIKAIIVADTYAPEYDFLLEDFAETVYQVLEIEPQRLIKIKQIQEFDGTDVKPITHAIYSTLTVGTHT